MWIKSINTFFKTLDILFIYLLYFCCHLLYALGLFFALSALFVALTPDILFYGGIAPEYAWQTGCFIGLPTAAMFIFKNACRLRIWRSYAHDLDAPVSGRWIKDLPGVLTIDFIKDILIAINIITATLGIFLIIRSESASGILYIAIALLFISIINVLFPSILARKIYTQDGLLQSMSQSVIQMLRHPWRVMAVRILPGFLRFLLFCLILCVLQYSETAGWQILSAGILIALTIAIEPVLWLTAINGGQNQIMEKV